MTSANTAQGVTHDDAESTPPPLTLAALFMKFLRFGALAFGGPVAQIAMVREELVERERWISSARFNRLLAVMQALPGPEAHELCVHMGMIARGRLGGLLAGLGFMLPGLLLMLIAAALYTRFVGKLAAAAPILLGVQIAVLAVIARALWRIGEHLLVTRVLVAVAIAAFALSLMYGGATGLGLPEVAGSRPDLAALFVTGLKGGLLTFGGAYTAIPYVRGDTVGRGWLDDASFLDGVAIAGVLPAPLVIFATFVGFAVGGLAGALAVTAGMFLPAFAFSLIFFERLEAIVNDPRLHLALAIIGAVTVGVMGATFIDLASATAARVRFDIAAVVLFAVALAAACRLRRRWAVPLILAGGGVAGGLVPL